MAIVAHREWVTSAGVHLPVPADRLAAADVLSLSLAGADALVTAVMTSLHSLCALRTRVILQELRNKARQDALQNAKQTSPKDRADVERYSKQVQIVTDDSHYQRLVPSLDRLGERLRTADRKLEKFRRDLRVRHRAFVRAGLGHASGAAADSTLARCLAARCETLVADIEFFCREIEGPVSAPPTSHAGPANSKAWFHLRGQARLGFKEAGAPSTLGARLFPDLGGPATDPVTKVRRQDGARKEINRAKKRRDSTK